MRTWSSHHYRQLALKLRHCKKLPRRKRDVCEPATLQASDCFLLVQLSLLKHDEHGNDFLKPYSSHTVRDIIGSRKSGLPFRSMRFEYTKRRTERLTSTAIEYPPWQGDQVRSAFGQNGVPVDTIRQALRSLQTLLAPPRILMFRKDNH